MSDPIYKIIERLALIEGRVTPVSVKHGLNAQQKSVPQLPALFKPRSISPVLTAKHDPKNPMKGYMVGDSVQPARNPLEEAMQEVEEDMVSKVKANFADYLEKLEKQNHLDSHLVSKAKRDLEIGDDEEVDEQQYEYEPDISGDLAKNIENNPGTALGTGIGLGLLGMEEDATWDADVAPPSDPGDTEAAHSIEDHLAADAAAPAAPMSAVSESPVKTYPMEDGSCFECYGDQESGFEIRRDGRSLPTRFPRMDHADMAMRLFQKRHKAAQQNSNQDYIQEK